MTRSLVAWGGALWVAAAGGHAPMARAALSAEIVIPDSGGGTMADEPEPPPAGESRVLWAQPRGKRLAVKIKAEPRRTAATVGEARGQTAIVIEPRVEHGPRLRGNGCKEWLRAQPAGYLCASEVTVQPGWLSLPPAEERPTGWQRLRYGVVSSALARLRGGAGRFLRAVLCRGDGVTVTRTLGSEVVLSGRQRLATDDVQLVAPPQVKAVSLTALPPGQRIAWAVPGPGESQVPLYPVATAPGGAASPVAYVPRYTLLYYSAGSSSDGSPGAGRVQVTVPEEATLQPAVPGADLRGSRSFEADAAQLRRSTPATPPSEVGADERWIDISITDQVATAYVGKTPLLAALVSTGTATRPGSFFIYRKYLSQTMANLSGAQSQYDYREVPWAQFFDGRIGLHAVLWHDLLGHPVSHGCVNLSPAAAEQLFAFTGPQLPPGWHSINGIAPDAALLPLRGTRVIVRR